MIMTMTMTMTIVGIKSSLPPYSSLFPISYVDNNRLRRSRSPSPICTYPEHRNA